MVPSADYSRPTVPDYELVRMIGRGGYGDVWLARGVTGVFRAIKIVWRDRFLDPAPYTREFDGIARFAAISLEESSHLALLHAGRDPSGVFFFYVMELADDAETGREIDPDRYVPLTLRELRCRRGRLPAAEVAAFGAALARGLADLHAKGLVHRDIKPSNVVVIGGRPKLADVGLVAAVSAGVDFVGTEGFVPPEGAGTHSADIFSLGLVLYELVTGSDRHLYPRLPPDFHRWSDRRTFMELNEALIRACDPSAPQRYRDASALRHELLLVQAGRSLRRRRAAERRAALKLRVAVALARLF